MTTLQMLNALPVVQKVMELKLPIKKAYKAYFLAKQINEKRDFFINEEKKLIEKYQAEVKEDGKLIFKNTENIAQFTQEHKEILEYQVDDIESLELSFSDLGDAKFTPAEILMLEGVINFID